MDADAQHDHGQADTDRTRRRHRDGGYNFTGSFNDPDAWDYDDSLAWAIWSHSGVVYTFTHSGSMHGWADRWLEWGSDTDSWDNSGTNAAGTIAKVISVVAAL